MAQAKGNGKSFVPVYGIPWKTFENFIDQRLQPLVEKDEVPPRIDRGFLKNLGGNTQTYLMSALRGFKLTDKENNVHPDLIELARDAKARPGRIADLWRTYYSEALELADSKSTHGQLEERWREAYQQSGETMRKAITFFMHGAQYAGLPLSPHWNTTKVPSGPRTPRTTRRRRGSGRGAEPETPTATPAGGDTFTVELKSGGSLSVTVSVPFWDLSDEDQEYVFELKKKIKSYKGKPTAPRSKKVAAVPEPPSAGGESAGEDEDEGSGE